MQEHSSTKTALLVEGCAISNRNFTGIFFPPHVRQRMAERGGDQRMIAERIAQVRQKHQQLRGDCALLGCSPVVIVEFRARRAIVQSVLEPGMPLKPGTPTVWA